MAGIAEAHGVQMVGMLPCPAFNDLWDAIIVDQQIKDQLLSTAILCCNIRPQVDRAVLPLHGIILLTGVPGTGKTSLAKGLSSRVAESLSSKFTFIQVDPHSLASSAHGRTQQAVTNLFATTISETAAQGPTIVLLDEVESLVADRSKLSLEANPIDVHRATDAALVQLDAMAERHRDLLVIATSNFPEAIDGAFTSRCDLVLNIPMPNEGACFEILKDTIDGMTEKFPPLKKLSHDPRLRNAARLCVGLDGRTVRKLVAVACTFDKRVALDPTRLAIDDICRAAEQASKERNHDRRRA
ncbi:MAG: AAA family ATPase [bacterium]|nr:AAA family ATPase [bacterium]